MHAARATQHMVSVKVVHRRGSFSESSRSARTHSAKCPTSYDGKTRTAKHRKVTRHVSSSVTLISQTSVLVRTQSTRIPSSLACIDQIHLHGNVESQRIEVIYQSGDPEVKCLMSPVHYLSFCPPSRLLVKLAATSILVNDLCMIR